jgi:hypothetical protein
VANPIHCIGCGAQLEPHCESKGCRWMRCSNLLNCDWRTYDFDHGVRLDKANRLDRLKSGPAYDGA